MDFLSVAVITILNFFIYATVAMGVRFVIVSYFKMEFVLCYDRSGLLCITSYFLGVKYFI